MNYLELKSPAKINIGLRITQRRPDGFHNIETMFYPVHTYYDQMSFSKKETFSFFCDNDLTVDIEDNLVVRALRKIESYIRRNLQVAIRLNKFIPAGGGLGGGSSNAAATLLALNEMFELHIPFTDLRRIALELGSDVPFFLRPKPCFASGRGEVLEYLDDFFLYKYIVIITPKIHISTAKAFQKYSLLRNEEKIADFIFQHKEFEPKNYHLFRNVFEEMITKDNPEIDEALIYLRELGAEYVSLSGSGSSVFGLFEKSPVIDKLSKIVRNSIIHFSAPEEEKLYY